MKSQIRWGLLAGIFGSFLLMFQNCSQVSFTPDAANLANSVDGLSSNDSGTDPNCRIDYANAAADVKVLFLVDASGSNENSGATVGTDPGQVWRLATLNTFVDAYKNKNNFFYGLLTFQGTTAKPQISSGGAGVFTNNLSTVAQGIASFDANIDGGNTPYDAALNLAKSVIMADLAIPSSKPTAYAVVMISDGVPTNDRYKGVNGVTNLKADVKSLVDLAPGKITVNSVFLYNAAKPSNSEEQYLRAMASVGGGAFIFADSKQTISIADSIRVSQEICQ